MTITIVSVLTSVNNDKGSSQRLHPVMQRLFISDERILVFSAMYGFVAGTVFMIAASTGQSSIANAALVYNYPAIVILLTNGGLSGVAPIVQAAVWILVSTGAWTLVAFFFYAIFKMFRIARRLEERQQK